MKLVAWVARNIRVDNDCNLGGAPISRKVSGRHVWLMPIAVTSFRLYGAQHGNPCPYQRSDRQGAVDRDDGAVDVDLDVQFLEEELGQREGWWLPINLSVRWTTRNTMLISPFPN